MTSTNHDKHVKLAVTFLHLAYMKSLKCLTSAAEDGYLIGCHGYDVVPVDDCDWLTHRPANGRHP